MAGKTEKVWIIKIEAVTWIVLNHAYRECKTLSGEISKFDVSFTVGNTVANGVEESNKAININ